MSVNAALVKHLVKLRIEAVVLNGIADLKL